ncbi:MAG: hypothetical protein IPK84_01260 [Candidatus Moraniibacteriota bacterium]|nr:MAG: hypothetical protein IPK84_01260 [Candidatus Moranbacteria bacterium]
MADTRKLFVVFDGDLGTVSVVQWTATDGGYGEEDTVLCEVPLSERAVKAYDAFEKLREIFGDGADSPLYSLLDELASAVYAATKIQKKQ